MKTIAAKVGIGDQYQLSKLFRRYFGIAPRDMRNTKTTRPENPASSKQQHHAAFGKWGMKT